MLLSVVCFIEQPTGDGTKQKVRRVRESTSQTTPVATPTRRAITNYKTVIQVLEASPNRLPATSSTGLLTGHGKLHGVNISRPYHNVPSHTTHHDDLDHNGPQAQLSASEAGLSNGQILRHVENITIGSTNQQDATSKPAPMPSNQNASGFRDEQGNGEYKSQLFS